MKVGSIMIKSKFSHTKHFHKCEKAITDLLEKLNDEIPNVEKTGEGLWICGALTQDNSIEITYRNKPY
jgi:hypothetical protein